MFTEIYSLENNLDFSDAEKQKAIALTDAGIDKAEKLLGVENIYTDKGIKYVHHLETAVRARAGHRGQQVVGQEVQRVAGLCR